jgi:hypothetical protein
MPLESRERLEKGESQGGMLVVGTYAFSPSPMLPLSTIVREQKSSTSRECRLSPLPLESEY